MAQFDVHRNDNPATREFAPYLVDLQHDLLAELTTRVVAPLIHASEAPKPVSRLNPVFEIEGNVVVMSTQELAGVACTSLGKRLDSLMERRDEIIAALDLVFTGI